MLLYKGCGLFTMHVTNSREYDWFIWFLLPIIFTSHYADAVRTRGHVQSDEEKLLDHLFTTYNPSARPVINSMKTVNVNLQFALFQIQELNVRSQVLTTTGLLILDWEDERLTWHRNVSDLDEIVIDGKAIWKPEFAVINGAEGIYEDFSAFQAVLRPSGAIHWEPGGVFKTMCTIDITYYPFDSQKCAIQFGAWSYYTSKMNLTTQETKIGLDTYEKNGEWEILDTHVERNEFAFDCCPHQKFSNILFTVYLRRRHTFYIMNVILPGIMTSAVLLSIFFSTPSQKVHIGVAALLSFRFFLLNVADKIPRSSDHVPLLGIYLTSTMAITTLAMVATVFVLNLYSMKDKPVPPWAKKIFVKYVAKMLCMCDCMAPPVKETDDNESGYSSQYGTTNSTNYHSSSHQAVHLNNTGPGSKNHKHKYKLITTLENKHILEEETDTDEFSTATIELQETYQSSCDMLPQDTPCSSLQNSPHLQKNRHHDAGQRRKKKSSHHPIDYSKDWVHVAAVCDRLFFWLCFIFILVTTMLLFHPLTTSRYFKIPIIEKNG